jgi:AcrR family transcriptional regulator
MVNTAESATRGRIMAAALGAFARQGFNGARVDAIARLAGVNKALLYYHVGGKEELYRAALTGLARGVKRDVVEIVRKNPDPLQRLFSIYGRLARGFQREPLLARVALREILEGGRHLDTATARAMGDVFGIVKATIEEGVRSGRFRPVNPLVIHVSAMGALLVYAVSAPFRERLGVTKPGVGVDPTWDEIESHVRRAVARGVVNRGPRRRAQRGSGR